MNSLPHLFLLSIALGAWASAEVPGVLPPGQYRGLWENSPFTSKPPPPAPVDVANPLDDYALGGISPITGGYRVTLLNKKNPDERITVTPQGSYPPEHNVKVISVTRKAGNPLATTVMLSMGTLTGTVTFEEALLALKSPPPPPVNHQGQPPGMPQNGQQPHPQALQGGQGQAQPGQPGGRQPRPRVVPPPNPGGAAPSTQSGNQRGQGPRRTERRR